MPTQTKQTKQKSAARPQAVALKERAARRELTPLQALIADEVADMLARGGQTQDTNNLIIAALGHMHYRRIDGLLGASKTQGEIDKMVADACEKDAPEWNAELRAGWKLNKVAEPHSTLDPKSVTERIRASVIENLRDQFSDFLTGATPEEQRLMLEILQIHSSSSQARNLMGELPLGEAFEYVIGRASGDWVKVPDRIRKQVERYIECLKAANLKDRAVA